MRKFKKNEMIKFIVLSIGTLLATHYLLQPIYAVTIIPTKSPTPSPSKNSIPTDSVELEKIQKIKDIVASKVAELDLVEKRGIIGKVRENTNMHIVIEDMKGKVRNIDVDELTNFSIGDKESKIGISDLEKNITYSFVGIYNKDTQRLLARTITKSENIPFFFEGVISSTNSKEFQIIVINSKGEEKTVDIQNSTKTYLSRTDGTLIKSGFSKLNVNQRVLIVGFIDLKDENLITSTRAIHFETLPPSKEMQQYVKVIAPTEAQ